MFVIKMTQGLKNKKAAAATKVNNALFCRKYMMLSRVACMVPATPCLIASEQLLAHMVVSRALFAACVVRRASLSPQVTKTNKKDILKMSGHLVLEVVLEAFEVFLFVCFLCTRLVAGFVWCDLRTNGCACRECVCSTYGVVLS